MMLTLKCVSHFVNIAFCDFMTCRLRHVTLYTFFFPQPKTSCPTGWKKSYTASVSAAFQSHLTQQQTCSAILLHRDAARFSIIQGKPIFSIQKATKVARETGTWPASWTGDKAALPRGDGTLRLARGRELISTRKQARDNIPGAEWAPAVSPPSLVVWCALAPQVYRPDTRF